MKLILCDTCDDVVRLQDTMRACKCGNVYGRYLADGLNVEISESSIPLGFANITLIMAIRNRPENGMGSKFTAFVIPKECPTIKYFT